MPVPTDNVYIHAPHLVSRRRRAGDAAVTLFMWLVYSYLWAPLISLIAWLLGAEFAYDVMIRSGGIHGLMNALTSYAIMVGAIVCVVSAWSYINQRRFRGMDRRNAAPIVTDQDLADFFSLDCARIAKLRSARVARVGLDEQGKIGQITRLGVPIWPTRDAANDAMGKPHPPHPKITAI